MRRIAYQPLTNSIVTGVVNKDGRTWRSGSKTIVTEDAIASVFEFLKSECKKGGTNFFEIKYQGVSGRMVFDLSEEDNHE